MDSFTPQELGILDQPIDDLQLAIALSLLTLKGDEQARQLKNDEELARQLGGQLDTTVVTSSEYTTWDERIAWSLTAGQIKKQDTLLNECRNDRDAEKCQMLEWQSEGDYELAMQLQNE
jgi:hypothetical protein